MLGTGATAGAMEPLTPLERLPCRRLVDLVTRQRYDDALILADSFVTANPEAPEGYFFRLTILNNRAIDYEDETDFPALKSAADSVLTICKRRLDAGDGSALLRFYLGSAEGFRMIHALRSGDYFEGLRRGKRAAAWLEDAVARDSSCYDAYVGLGTYYYFKSRYSGVLRSAGLVSDRRELGINYLRLGAKKGLLTDLAATSSIAWIDIDRQQFDSAAAIAGSLLERYPGNRAFLWCLGKAQTQTKQWNDALVTYSRILESVRNSPRNNHYNEVGCLHSMARASAQLGNWKEVIHVCDEALSLRLDPAVARRKSADLRRLRDFRKEGLKALELKIED